MPRTQPPRVSSTGAALVLALTSAACGDDASRRASSDASAGTQGTQTGATTDATDPSSTTNATVTDSTTASTSATTASTSDDGIPPGCGDARPDPGEDCDDGNSVQADGCNNDCTISGSVLWEHTHASGLDLADEVLDVAVDGDADAYVAGYVATETTGEDMYLRRYAEAGGLEWTTTVGGGAGGNDRATGIAVGSGSVYVVGYVTTGGSGTDIWMGRYDLEGNQVWATSYGGVLLGNDQGLAAAVDPAGNVVFAGFQTVMSQGQDAWVRKVAPDGTVAWTVGFGGAAASHDVAAAVATDAAGNVVVAGYQTVSGVGRDIWVRKYDPAGSELWTTGHDGPESLDDEARGVAIDGNDDIVVVGFEGASAFPWRLWVRKYNSGGAEQWTQTDEGPGAQGAFADGVSVLPDGRIVVTGAQRDGGLDEVLVRKYAADGTTLWSTNVRGIEGASHYGHAVAIDDSGRSYAAGGVDKGVDARDAWLGRFAQ